MDEDKRKILVCGDVNGKFVSLFSRVSSINQKSGPFDFLLCVGDFFSESQTGWEPYKNGTLKVPIPVYILGPNDNKLVKFYPENNDGEICPNVNYLGKRGVLTSSGLKIAYLSGKESSVSESYSYTKKDVTTVRDIALRGKPSFTGVDILLTSEWPENVTQHDTNSNVPSCNGSRSISWLACQLKPRYHFVGLENIFYERPPYSNYGDIHSHCTRFIALGKVGNSNKQKFLYALSLTPIDQMKANVLYQATTDQTECPYPKQMTMMDISSESKTPSSQFFYDMNAQYEDKSVAKRRRKNSDGSGEKRVAMDQSKCWFCLGSPSVEKHLVISIGDEMYLALAKGGLTKDHVMILPVQHHQTSAHLSDEAKKEVKKFKSSLKKCFRKNNLVPVFFERNYKTSHLQLQVIPVPVKCVDALAGAFQTCAEEQDLHLDELPHHSDLKDMAPVGVPYFYVELPDGNRLFCQCKKNFPLFFGRDVLASEEILNMPDRINWRDCVLSKEEEDKVVKNFRDKFQAFDFTTDV